MVRLLDQASSRIYFLKGNEAFEFVHTTSDNRIASLFTPSGTCSAAALKC